MKKLLALIWHSMGIKYRKATDLYGNPTCGYGKLNRNTGEFEYPINL